MDKLELSESLQAAIGGKKLGQSNLLIGHSRDGLEKLALSLAKTLLCKEANGCGSCQSCYLLEKQSHPDCANVKPEKAYGALKIDQIRALQPVLYLPPQLGHNRVIIIHAADKLNKSAANSLLKILEEPSGAVYFILVAEQISTVLPTILSRCQRWMMPLSEVSTEVMPKELPEIVNDIFLVHNQKIALTTVSAKWAKYELNELARCLYSLTAQMIRYYFSANNELAEPALELAKRLKPLKLFAQLENLTSLIKNLNHSLSINQALSIDTILVGYT